MSKKFYKGEPDYAVPAGELLRFFIEHNGISVENFLSSVGINTATFESVCNSNHVPEELAKKIECVFGVPCYFWKRAEDIYNKRSGGQNV